MIIKHQETPGTSPANTARKTALNPTGQKTDQKMQLLSDRSTALLAAIFCLTIASIPNFAAADYLDELSSESESTAKMTPGTQRDTAYYKDMAKMETLLQSEKPSAYKFYEKLSSKSKSQVFDSYTADSSNRSDRLSHAQSKVLDLYFKQ